MKVNLVKQVGGGIGGTEAECCGKIPKTGLTGSDLNQQAQKIIHSFFPFALNVRLPTTTSW